MRYVIMSGTSENIGGLYSKLGNRYEALWLVLKLLEVLGGHGKSLKVEGIGGAFAGFEVCFELEGYSEWHQTKINGAGANWTRRALEREGVTAAFKRRLEASTVDLCVTGCLEKSGARPFLRSTQLSIRPMTSPARPSIRWSA